MYKKAELAVNTQKKKKLTVFEFSFSALLFVLKDSYN